MIIGLAVFSHWILDLIAHPRDLAIYDNRWKVGFGLWNYRDPEFALEIALLAGGIATYLTRNAMPAIRKGAVIAFGIALVIVQIGDTYVPRTPLTDKATATGVWVFYTLFVIVAFAIEKIGRREQTKCAMIIVIFGVSGAGKTTVGKLLARELGWRFIEADDFHPAANIEKMRSGHPLTDEDRWPWLDCLRKQIEQLLSAGENAVLACSALKRVYRDRLRVSVAVKFVFLRGDYALVEKQLRSRRGHFMNAALLQSQFDALEEPQPDENVSTIELGRTPEEIVERIKAKLSWRSAVSSM